MLMSLGNLKQDVPHLLYSAVTSFLEGICEGGAGVCCAKSCRLFLQKQKPLINTFKLDFFYQFSLQSHLLIDNTASYAQTKAVIDIQEFFVIYQRMQNNF